MPDSTGQVRGKILISGVMNLQSVTLGSRHQKEEHRWKCVLLKDRLKGWQWIFWAQTPLGHRYILVIGDYFTKWKEAFPLRDMEATSIARVLVNELICRFGVPDNIRTDQGKNFESKLVKEVCILLGVRKTRTTPYHPQSDERFNKTLRLFWKGKATGIFFYHRFCLRIGQALMKPPVLLRSS